VLCGKVIIDRRYTAVFEKPTVYIGLLGSF